MTCLSPSQLRVWANYQDGFERIMGFRPEWEVVAPGLYRSGDAREHALQALTLMTIHKPFGHPIPPSRKGERRFPGRRRRHSFNARTGRLPDVWKPGDPGGMSEDGKPPVFRKSRLPDSFSTPVFSMGWGSRKIRPKSLPTTVQLPRPDAPIAHFLSTESGFRNI